MAIVPVMSVPMKLPWIVLFEPFPVSMPRLLPETMLRALTVVPPKRLFEPLVVMPGPVFPRATVPVTSTPMTLPCTTFPVPS